MKLARRFTPALQIFLFSLTVKTINFKGTNNADNLKFA